MKTIDEVIKALEYCTGFDFVRCQDCPGYCEPDCNVQADALHYLKEYRVVTDICHKHGIASVWGQVLPDPEKTDWDKKLYFGNAYDNDPLTWDELKDMEGKPVWVECNRGGRIDNGWRVILHVDRPECGCEDAMYCISAPCKKCTFQHKNCGKTWQAYRKERSDGLR